MYARPGGAPRTGWSGSTCPTPSWMRAPGRVPRGCSRSSRRWTSSPIALRHRPGRAADPQRARPPTRRAACRSARRNLVACLREGADRFGWAGRPRIPGPASAADGRWLARHRGRRVDLPGAAPALDGDRRRAATAGSSCGSPPPTSAPARGPRSARSPRTRWTWRPTGCGSSSATARCRPRRSPAARWAPPRGARRWPRACEALLKDGSHGRADTDRGRGGRTRGFARHSFGAQFAEVRVDADTGEVRVPRLLGVFAAGRIINPKTRPLAVHRRHDHGPRDGADGGDRRRRRGSATSSTTTSPSTTSRPARTCSDSRRSGSTSTTRT